MRPDPVLSRAVAISTPALVVVLALSSGGCTSKSGSEPAGAGSTSVPTPLAPASADIVAYAAVRGLDDAFERAAEVAKRAGGPDAEPVTAAGLKSQLGAMLGDPQLAFLDGSRPIVVAVLKAASADVVPPIVALIPAKEGNPYGQQLSAMGMQSRFADGLLAVAQTPEALGESAKVRAVYDRISGAKLPMTARVFLDADALVSIYGGTLKAGLGQLTGLLGGFPGPAGENKAAFSQSIARLLKMEALAFLSILEQSDALQLDLDWGRTGFDLALLVAGKPGSELAGFCTRSAAVRAPQKSLLRTEGSGIIGTFAFDPKAMDALFAKVLTDLSTDPDAAKFLTPATVALFTSMAEYWSGSGAVSMKISPGDFSFGYDQQVTSGEQFLGKMEKAVQLMAPGGPFADMYKGMDIELSSTFQKDVRKHSGVAVHRARVSSKLGPEAAPGIQEKNEVLKSMLNYELDLAVVGQRALVSGKPEDLDRMIDAALANQEGTRLDMKAIETFGAGRQFYVDYEVVGMMKGALAAVSGSDPNGAKIKEMASKLTPTTPMTFAVTCSDGRAQLQTRLPMEIIEKISQLSPH